MSGFVINPAMERLASRSYTLSGECGRWTVLEFDDAWVRRAATQGRGRGLYALETRHETEWGTVRHLMIGMRALSRSGMPLQPPRSFERLQAIKNDLLGKDAWAVEVYPADSALVNEIPIIHLWALPTRPPFGLDMFSGTEEIE